MKILEYHTEILPNRRASNEETRKYSSQSITTSYSLKDLIRKTQSFQLNKFKTLEKYHCHCTTDIFLEVHKNSYLDSLPYRVFNCFIIGNDNNVLHIAHKRIMRIFFGWLSLFLAVFTPINFNGCRKNINNHIKYLSINLIK